MSSPLPPPATMPMTSGEQSYPFHRLMRRSHNYRWWRPIAFAGTGTGFYVALLIMVMLVVFVAMLVNPATWATDAGAGTSDETLFADAQLDMTSPLDFSMTMVSLIVMIPAVYLAYVLLGSKPVGQLFSVAGKIRWRWFGLALGTSAILFAVYFALSFGFSGLSTEDSGQLAPYDVPADPLFFAILVLLLTPLQCAAEELVFRGALMQVVGSWLKHPLFAILLPVPLFTFGHLYDVYGLLDVAAFAVAAGYLTWRTGGLEAAMAMHIINNTFLFMLGALGQIDLNEESSDGTSLIISVLFMAVLTAVLTKLADKKDIQRTAGALPPPPQLPVLQPWSAPQQMPYPNQAYWAPPVEPWQHNAQQNYPQGNYPPPPPPMLHDPNQLGPGSQPPSGSPQVGPTPGEPTHNDPQQHDRD